MSDSQEIANQFAKAIAETREMLAPLDEATLGYRRQLEEQGWSPTVAEQMALAFHAMLFDQLRAT